LIFSDCIDDTPTCSFQSRLALREIEGKYDPNKTIASFIGFGPAEDPKFVMLVILDRPTARIYGAETAAPIFFSIAQKLLNYFE
jgi:cell division protein FtsI/penicillin-binding protein 2